MRTVPLIVLVLLFFHAFSFAQKVQVVDSLTQDGVPFATVRMGKTSQGLIADLNGYFQPAPPSGSNFIEVSATGYRAKKVPLPIQGHTIRLSALPHTLDEVTIRPPMDKIRRILNASITARHRNDPDGYDQHQCHVYFKMTLDKVLPDTVLNDERAAKRKNAGFFTGQHLLVSETYSVRTWRRPQQLQEDIRATRISGLQHAVFTSLATDVLPFHAYSNYIKLNEKDYHNPISKGYEQFYRFNLSNELLDGTDTVWVLSYRPARNTGNLLSGSVYIHSDGYAISQIIAQATDSALQQTVRIEQQYSRVPHPGGNRWFPTQLNYIIDMGMKTSTGPYNLHLKGNSQIDSIVWDIPASFSFDKKHTIRVQPGADKANDSLLQTLRPTPLTTKEDRSYQVIDSIGKEVKADRMIAYMRHIPEGKISLSVFDVDIARILAINKYEGIRLGLGLQTNDKLVKWLSVGGWGGYGFRDERVKYGVFAEVYADKYREFVIRAGYSDDISDPGRIKLHRTLDKGYLRTFLLQRADHVKTYHISIRKKIAYWNTELSAQQQEIVPLYAYSLNVDGLAYRHFTVQEASLNLRYAYAERTAPFFGTYQSMGSKYPVLYGKATAGKLTSGSYQSQYIQAITALTWQKRINRIGNEQFMLQAARTWSTAPLPLTKLFAGNGFRYDDRMGLSLYTFGGLMSVYPYQYYSDEFVQFIYRHDFDWRLYRLGRTAAPISSAPNIALQYGLLYGKMANKDAHQQVPFTVPEQGHHEAGILLNNLIRMRATTYYMCFNLGYFTPVSATIDPIRTGKFVLGATAEF